MTDARPSPTLALLRRARAAELELAAVFDRDALTVRKHDVLRAIAAVPGLSPGELARRAGIDVLGVGTLVRGLVESGLVRERRSAEGHTASLTATEKGMRSLARIDTELDRLDTRLFAGSDALADALLADAQVPPPAAPED